MNQINPVILLFLQPVGFCAVDLWRLALLPRATCGGCRHRQYGQHLYQTTPSTPKHAAATHTVELATNSESLRERAMDPNTIGDQFTSAAAAYAAAIQPYALRLFLGLLFIEVLVTAIQYMIDQGDAPRYLGRTFRHLLSAGLHLPHARECLSLDEQQ